MALELFLFVALAVSGLIAFLVGAGYKVSFIFLIGCLLLAISGISLFAYDGLIIDREITSVAGDGSFVYSNVEVNSSNLAVSSLGILFVILPLVSFFVLDFGGVKQRKPNLYHF